MTDRTGTPQSNFTLALEAIGNLALRDLDEMFSGGQMAAMSAHYEIELAPINRKTGIFYRHLLPLRKNLISLLADTYRRYFKLALAHPRQARSDSEKWACSQLQPAIDATLEWIRDWFILACDGENGPQEEHTRIISTLSVIAPHIFTRNAVVLHGIQIFISFFFTN